jgi:hypothetical protein
VGGGTAVAVGEGIGVGASVGLGVGEGRESTSNVASIVAVGLDVGTCTHPGIVTLASARQIMSRGRPDFGGLNNALPNDF